MAESCFTIAAHIVGQVAQDRRYKSSLGRIL